MELDDMQFDRLVTAIVVAGYLASEKRAKPNIPMHFREIEGRLREAGIIGEAD